MVAERARPFAAAPSTQTLLHLRDGVNVGNWRDSEVGLGFGRIPFDVNVALVPAALESASRLWQSPHLGHDVEASREASELSVAWGVAHTYFEVTIPAQEAREMAAAYARQAGIDPDRPLQSLQGDVAFPALALDHAGVPVPVMHTDDSFVLLYTSPDPHYLDGVAERLIRPFPAGLFTPVGYVVANPAFCRDEAIARLFTNGNYHGTVIWSFQHAMLAMGLERQLNRADLPPSTRASLAAAHAALSDVLKTVEPWKTSELWSFVVENGYFELVPFGASAIHDEESNAIQLWSVASLRAPRV
jgi:hypothetical protein